jgi:hypothetical protein
MSDQSQQSDPAFTPFLHSMTREMLRDYFAANVQADDRLVKSVRAMDDHDLAIFARCPDAESEFFRLGEPEKYVLRYLLEAKAIARVRYMQADAMIAEREKAKADDK